MALKESTRARWRREDMDYFGLTYAERSAWLGRLARYEARRAKYWSDRAVRYSKTTAGLAWLGVGLSLGSLLARFFT